MLTIFVRRSIFNAWQSSEDALNLTLTNLQSGVQGCNIIFHTKVVKVTKKSLLAKFDQLLGNNIDWK